MFTLEIQTDNDSFADGNGSHEIARILRNIANHFEETQTFDRGNTGDGYSHDSNGNRVAIFTITL